MGGAYQQEGKFKESMNSYNSALEIRKKFYGEIHQEIAETLNNIGFLYEEMKEFNIINKFLFKIIFILI